MHIPKTFRDCFFYRTTLATFEVSFSIRKKILKKKVNREIAFALISLLHVQIQEPASRSITTRMFVFLGKFIIAKYLKQEVNDNLSIFVDEHSQCISRAILKPVYQFGIPNSMHQMLKSIDFWCKLSSTFLVAEPRERFFELFRMQNRQKFPWFHPWTLLGRASSATPDSPSAQRFFS